MGIRRITVSGEASGKKLENYLGSAVPGATLPLAQRWLREGRVRIRGKLANGGRKLWGGEEVEIDLPAPPRAPAVEGPAITVLADDPEVLVVDKPAGWTVEPEGRVPGLVDLVASQVRGIDVFGSPVPGVSHRLDRETTGCLALARTDTGLAALDAAFQAKRVDKRYLALVLGSPPDSERLEAPYARDPEHPRKYTTRVPSARHAALAYEVRERFPGAALLEVKLETGRTHQIRVQLSEAGYPLVADPLYGPDTARTHPAAAALGRLALHAARLTLEGLGAQGRIAAEAPLPADFARALALLRGGAP